MDFNLLFACDICPYSTYGVFVTIFFIYFCLTQPTCYDNISGVISIFSRLGHAYQICCFCCENQLKTSKSNIVSRNTYFQKHVKNCL